MSVGAGGRNRNRASSNVVAKFPALGHILCFAGGVLMTLVLTTTYTSTGVLHTPTSKSSKYCGHSSDPTRKVGLGDVYGDNERWYKHRDFLKEHLDAFLALTLNKPLPLESMLMLPDFFRYKDPKQINAPSLTVCACAKCGTTSLYTDLYASVNGQPIENPQPTFYHKYWKWNVDGVTASRTPGDVHMIVFRDPVERYISAWHSKVKCCDGTLTPCYGDSEDDYIPALLKRNGNVTAQNLHCLPFADFVLQLERAKHMGLLRQLQLDIHFRPQHLRCPVPQGTPTIVGDIGVIGFALNSLEGLGLKPQRTPHLHDANRTGFRMEPSLLQRLRKLAADEYKYFDRTSRRQFTLP